jgi:hypothetical protein
MGTIHTVLREDFGPLDRDMVKSALMSERGVLGVSFEKPRNHLIIEYDPAIVNGRQLMAIMCRHGVLPEPCHAASKRETGGD